MVEAVGRLAAALLEAPQPVDLEVEVDLEAALLVRQERLAKVMRAAIPLGQPETFLLRVAVGLVLQANRRPQHHLPAEPEALGLRP